MRLLGIVLLVLLLSGCTEPGTGAGEELEPADGTEAPVVPDEAPPASVSYEADGTLLGAGVCTEQEALFAGVSTMPHRVHVPEGVETLRIDLAWDLPAMVCLRIQSPDGWHFHQWEPSLSQGMEVEHEALAGEWVFSVMALGTGPASYSLRVEGS